MKAERRFLPIEVRADEDGKIRGHGAVFYNADDPGTEYELWTNVFERVMPGAFTETIANDDIRSFFNHDPSLILGRNRAGTLKLGEDARGFTYEVDAPDTQAGRDTKTSIARGDVTGSSFMFQPVEERWIVDEENDREIREIHKAKVFEVGPVTFPAYESADTSVRDLRTAREAEKTSRDADEDEARAENERRDNLQAQIDRDKLALRIRIAEMG